MDIDGVISIYGFPPLQRPDGHFVTVDGIPHFLSAAAGAHLLDLAESFELRWCSGWEEKADEYLPAALGVPKGLAHVVLRDARASDGAHWKLAALDAKLVPERPVAWVDDDFDERCYAWAAARPGPTLLVSSDPAVGLTADHVAELRAWERSLDG